MSVRLGKLFGGVCAATIISGCASNVEREFPHFQDSRDVKSAVQQMHDAQLRQLRGESQVVTEIDGPYLGGAESVPLGTQGGLPPSLNGDVGFFTSQALSLSEVGARITDMTGIAVRVLGGESSRALADFNYDGSLTGLLDSVANRYDATWEYEDGEITLDHGLTRVYELAIFPGTVGADLEMTTTNDSSDSGVGQSTSYSQSQGGMSTTIDTEANPWEDVEKAIDQIVTAPSTYSINRSAMSVIVSGPPSVQSRVKDYIDRYNEVLMRQVALNIQVYTFDASDNLDQGFNLDSVYQSLSNGYSISVSGPSISGIEGGGVAANILESSDSRWSGSSALVKALNEWGTTSLVTSGTGLILSGQVFPINAVNRQGYLARTSTNQVANAGVSSELEPGVVTTGFSMQVTPYIRTNNSLLIQYSFSLSTLVSLEDKSSGEATIQLPNVDDRSFIQRSMMPLGSTLVLAGFQRDADALGNAVGVSGYNRSRDQRKQLIFVTITASKA